MFVVSWEPDFVVLSTDKKLDCTTWCSPVQARSRIEVGITRDSV